MMNNKLPVLIKVPPPSSSTAMCAHQHYGNGHVDNEGPSRADIAKHLGKQMVTFSTTEPSAAPLYTSSSASPVMPLTLTTMNTPPVPIPPLAHVKKPPPA